MQTIAGEELNLASLTWKMAKVKCLWKYLLILSMKARYIMTYEGIHASNIMINVLHTVPIIFENESINDTL